MPADERVTTIDDDFVPRAEPRALESAESLRARRDEVRQRLTAVAENTEQALFASEALPQTARIMFKDEDLCVHCGLCAERCPTAAWDMMQFDLLNPYAGQEPWPTTAPTASTTSA